MKEIKTLVEERKETLLRLKQEKEKALQNVLRRLATGKNR